jgi:hypothetical protein
MNCKSTLRAKLSDGTLQSDRNETVVVLGCPVCKRNVYVDLHAFR